MKPLEEIKANRDQFLNSMNLTPAQEVVVRDCAMQFMILASTLLCENLPRMVETGRSDLVTVAMAVALNSAEFATRPDSVR